MANICIEVPVATLEFSADVEVPVFAAVVDMVKHLCTPLVAAFMLTEVQSLFTFTGRQKDVRGISTSTAKGFAPFLCV